MIQQMNIFTIQPNPESQWMNIFTVQPNPESQWMNIFTVQPNPESHLFQDLHRPVEPVKGHF